MSGKRKAKALPPICPHCDQAAVLTSGAVIYPHRPDLAENAIWQCEPCGAYVGCHPGSTRALGTPANAELRNARMRVHGRLDPIWQDAVATGGYEPEDARSVAIIRATARRRVYAWLSDRLGIPSQDTHTGMFDIETCRRAWRALDGVNYAEIRSWAKARRQEQVPA